MRKIETIWHHILFEALNSKRYKWTQQELSILFGYSLSTINHAIKIPSEIGAIRKETKFFVLQDFQKLLYYWASLRNFKKDIIYSAYSSGSVHLNEGIVPSNAIYACYSSASKFLNEPPTDYSKVYFYINGDDLDIVRQRFPNFDKKTPPNVFALCKDQIMDKYGKTTTVPQTFVDIWNLSDWYAKDFNLVLEEKINALLS